MITKYKNNFPEVEAFLWDGDIEKAKEFFGEKWNNICQYKEDNGNKLLVIHLADDLWSDAWVPSGLYYIVRLLREGPSNIYIKVKIVDFEGQYTKI